MISKENTATMLSELNLSYNSITKKKMWIMYEKELKEKDTQDSSLTSWSHELDIK